MRDLLTAPPTASHARRALLALTVAATSLVGTSALADDALYQQCCAELGADACPTVIEVAGPGATV